jgi:Zn-dependent peptidase ImmA (M78 family)
MTSPKPRFGFVYDKACEFLLTQGIDSLPLNPFDIIHQNHWGLVTYSDLCTFVPSSACISDIALTCQSNYGFTVYNGNNYCIAYNEAISVKSRVNFTLMHEVGHIVCGHFDGSGSTLESGDYRRLEVEANFFATNVLAPAAVVTACGFNTPQLLHCACGISFEAAKVRLRQLQNFISTPADEKIRRAFSTYIKVNVRHTKVDATIEFDEGYLAESLNNTIF